MANCYLGEGKPDLAEKEFRAALALAPSNADAHYNLGLLFLSRRKPKEAIAPLREATDRSGKMPLIAAMLGHALVATDDPKNFPEAKSIRFWMGFGDHYLNVFGVLRNLGMLSVADR